MGDLDGQLKIVTNSNEEKDFRLQVIGAANSSRASAAYSLIELKKKNAALAQTLIQACALENIETPFDFRALFEELSN